MTTDVELLFGKAGYFEHAMLSGGQRMEDIYSLNVLQTLLIGYPYLPFTGATFRPYCLNHIVNDIVVNQRKQIIEFGSGISTIVIGRLLKRNGIDGKLLSVEHDAGWVEVMERLVKAEGLEGLVELLHAPLVKNSSCLDDNEWYDPGVVEREIGEKRWDMVIVDGPPAYLKGKELARFPALPFMRDRLSGRCSFYLDDVNRDGEKAVIRLWEMRYALEFKITGGTLAYCYEGASFYTEPYVNKL